MERRAKFVLLACILMIAGAIVLCSAYLQSVLVGYPVGLAIVLLGSIIWVSAE